MRNFTILFGRNGGRAHQQVWEKGAPSLKHPHVRVFPKYQLPSPLAILSGLVEDFCSLAIRGQALCDYGTREDFRR